MTKLTIMFILCFIQVAEYGASNLFLPAHLLALAEDGRARATTRVLSPLLCEMEADLLERGVLSVSSNCAVDPVAAFLAFARVGETD